MQGFLNIAQLREQLEAGKSVPYTPSRPCIRCGGSDMELRQSGPQLPVRCTKCDLFSYNAPRAEVGLTPTTLKTLCGDVSASQQARILDRDHGRCVLCSTAEDLTIGHLLSVADGARVGATPQELGNDANLAAMCATCNAGLGQRSVSLLTALLMRYLLEAEILHRRDAVHR